MKELTPKQRDLLLFIDSYQSQNNKIPTFNEMSKHMGTSIPNVQHKLSALFRKRVLLRENIYKILATESGALPQTVESRNTSAESGPLTNKIIKIL